MVTSPRFTGDPVAHTRETHGPDVSDPVWKLTLGGFQTLHL